MKDRLAEQLLARVLEWNSEEVATERPIVQALAAYKYDEYQQFSAGSRFIENLALWLNQFGTPDERRVAYEFVKTRLVFCSSTELRHLVEISYPDHIRPRLLERAASNAMMRFRPAAVAAQTEFRVRQRQCLFLGLSDGARIDTFRRANVTLNHEQIWQTHELNEDRVEKLIEKLGEHLEQITGGQVPDGDRKFRTLVLLDDFSASGTSYYALPAQAPTGGKVTRFFEDLCSGKPVASLVDLANLEVYILLYVATEQALDHLKEASAATWGKQNIPCSVIVVQTLPRGLKLTHSSSADVGRLIADPRYYDHDIFDSHFAKGGTSDARYGYAACGLPVVLYHNSPNNSVALLMSYETLKFRGLFPRIQRHREMS